MDAAQNSQFLACEYYPPGNYIGEFEYASFPILPGVQAHGFLSFVLAKTFKSENETKGLEFYRVYIEPFAILG